MLQFRARGFNLRDNFPDVLKGFRTAEELQDYREDLRQSRSTAAAEAEVIEGTLGTEEAPVEQPEAPAGQASATPPSAATEASAEPAVAGESLEDEPRPSG